MDRPLPGNVVPASRLLDRPGRRSRPTRPRWRMSELAGQLTELSGLGDDARLTAATAVVLDAQRQAETVAWISGSGSSFYPPDVADNGVDLEALAVVRVRDRRTRVRAAERLLRSGAFGLVVVDLGDAPRASRGLQGRLRSLVREHEAAVLFLTEKHGESSSLGSLVSLRGQARRRRLREDLFVCELRALKDKHRGPGWTREIRCRGVPGV